MNVDFVGAVLQTDISGFTALAETLARRGAEGVEELTRRLDEYFGALVDAVLAQGGDVSKFAGDALLALWPVDSPEDLPAAVAAAVRCGLQAQRDLHGLEGLAMRIGVGAGEVSTAVLGGVDGCWETVVAGPEVTLTGRAEACSPPGGVAVTPNAWRLLGEGFPGEPLGDGFMWILGAPEDAAAPEVLPLPRRSDEALRPFVLGCVQARLDAGQAAWLGELRRVSVLFAHLPGLGDEVTVEQGQALVHMAQGAVLKREGTVNKLTVDNKGSLFLAVFGLPPLGHEDDAVRCLEAALEIQETLRQFGNYALGVATGRVFCGAVGNDRRREYTVLGTVVNLAARIMQQAPRDVLCDEATWLAARERIGFETVPPVRVKGRDEPVPVHRPREKVLAARRRSPQLVGRVRERQRIAERLEAFARRREGGLAILEGDPGIGKSRLLEEALACGRALGLSPLVGEADAVEKSTPYFAWRPVFRNLFGALPEEPAERAREVLRRLEPHPDLVGLAPLLDAVMPLELPDNGITSQMRGQVRADNTELLLEAVLDRFWEHPALVVLEDGHWLDSASWSLLGSLLQDRTDLLVLMTTRPLEEPVPEEFRKLAARAGTLRLVLEALSREEALDLACRSLGVPALPGSVADFLVERAEGNPFFSQELVRSLQESGFLEVAAGRCDVAEGLGDLRALDVPATVQGVVTSRLDRLEPARLMILKVASVLGRTFRFRDFEAVYPIEGDVGVLQEHLEALEALDLVRPEAAGSAWSFTHVITQEVAYNLMLYGQRKELHGALARWLEAEHAAELSTFYPLLAHHWERAAVPERALDFLERAGEQALYRGANREAAEFFRHAHALGVPATDRRRAHWEVGLGRAIYGLGDIQAARGHLEAACRLLQLPIPTGGVKVALGLLRELARQAWHRTPFARLPDRPAQPGSDLMDAADAHGLLGEVYYLALESLPTVYAGIRGLNLAETVGSRTAEAAEFSGRMALAFSAVGLHGIAGFYADHGVRVARESGSLDTQAKVMWLAAVQKMVLPPRWEEAFALFEECLAIAGRLGDLQNLASGCTTQGYGRFYHGEFARAAELFEENVRVARLSENRMHEEWGLSGWTGALLRLGREEDAEARARQTLEIFASGIFDPTEELRSWVNLALAVQRQGRIPEALEAVERARDLLRRYIPTPSDYHTMDAYSGIVEVYLGFQAETGELARWRSELRDALRGQESYCRVFPWGRPRLAWTSGRVAWVQGRREQARSHWRRGLEMARRMDLPYEQALCLQELGRAGQEGTLEQAAELFERTGAAFELRRLRG